MRRCVPALVALVLASLLAGCGSSGAQEDAASAFLSAWARGDVAAAAAATDDPAAATTALQSVDRALGLGAGQLDVGDTGSEGDLTTVSYTASWPLAGVVDPWRYTGRVAVAPGPDGTWRVRWQPQDVHPQLGAGQALSLSRALPARAPLLTADGRPLVAPTETVTVGLVPNQVPDIGSVAATLAAALSPVTGGFDAAEIVADAGRARPGDFVEVVTLRRPDYDAVRDRIYTLPGVVFRTGTDLLGPTATFAQPLLGRVAQPSAEDLQAVGPGITAADEIGTSGLQQAFNAELTGTASAAVRVLGAGGVPVAELAALPGRAPAPVRTTLDLRVQQAAEEALAAVPRTAAIVAVRPSDGALLAVANSPTAPFDVALAGRYPPGSTFKIVTAAAALEAGQVRPDTPVDCPPTTTLGGRVLPNEDSFGLGTVPLTTAFARSCNTTFAQLGVRAGSDALAASAARFGIGAGWQLPVDSFAGAYTGAGDAAALGANAIGQGTDLVSPLADALLAATVARGSVPTPVLVPARPGPAAAPPPAPAPGVTAALAPMMRGVVTDGTATELAAVPGLPVAGKTGTAEHGTDTAPQAHSWFTGYRGDLAFSVFVEDGQTGGVPADPVAVRFLGALAG